MQILGIRIDNLTKRELLEKLDSFLEEGRFHQIATVNPEFILEAQDNSVFRANINCCSLNIADGFGIKLAGLIIGERLKYRIAGVDLMHEILRRANKKRMKLFLATNKDGLSSWQETRDAILKIYPDIQIEGADLDKRTDSCTLIIDQDILFSNFGAPHQETFLSCHKNGKIRLAIGLGGSFDFLTGKIRRAPKFLQRMGLEWMWRLLQQPQRWKRIWNATVVFMIKVILDIKK
jgi:N-acetylglucosaminyldiphosphoundecaprenol N-acetyl-beta-D-mannosaminyltransferase